MIALTRVGGRLPRMQWVYDFLPQDILPHDTLSLHPDCNPNPNTYPNPSPKTYPNPNPNPNLDVEAKCHEIRGCGVKRREVKSPFPVLFAFFNFKFIYFEWYLYYRPTFRARGVIKPVERWSSDCWKTMNNTVPAPELQHHS